MSKKCIWWIPLSFLVARASNIGGKNGANNLTRLFLFFRNSKHFCLSPACKDSRIVRESRFDFFYQVFMRWDRGAGSLLAVLLSCPSSEFKISFQSSPFPSNTHRLSAFATSLFAPPPADSHVSISLHSRARTEKEVQEFNTHGFPII